MVNELSLAANGVGGYGLNIISSEEAMNTEPDVVWAITNAVVEGYARACADQPGAVSFFARIRNPIDGEYVANSLKKVCVAIGERERLGSQDLAGWQRTLDTYRDVGLVKGNIDVAGLFVTRP